MNLNSIKKPRLTMQQAYKLKQKSRSIVFSIARYVFLIAFSYVLLYPILYMISHAFQDPNDYLDPTVQWIPKHFSMQNFSLAIEATDFGNAFLHSITLEIVSALIEVASCCVAAYGLARFNFVGKRLLNFLLLLNILVPATMIIIPSYVNFQHTDFLGILGLFKQLTGVDLRPNLLNTPLVFYIPSFLAVGLQAGLFIYIFRQFFKNFPKELEEAAWIDGSGPWGTFLRIVVPSSGVSVMTVFIFSIIWHWNDFYLASMYLTQDYPLAVYVKGVFSYLFTLQYNSYSPEALNAAMASCLMFITPVLLMYLLLQRKFMASITMTGIVG